jgi:transcriptional regulator with XRE-family HTH domain
MWYNGCMSFAKLLQQTREAQSLSQRALARKLPCSYGLIAFFENGSRMPSVVTAIEIALVLDADPHAFALEVLTDKAVALFEKELGTTSGDKERASVRTYLEERFGTEFASLISKSTNKRKSA